MLLLVQSVTVTNIYLSGYSLRMNNRKGNLKFNKEDNENTSKLSPNIFRDLTNYLNTYASDYHDNDESKNLIKIKNLNIDDSKLDICNIEGKLVTGIIETGEYGYSSELVHVPKKALSHKREVDEAEMLPFYFLIFIPNGRDEGIIILERFGHKGVRRTFLNNFGKYFSQSNPNFRIEINPLVTKKLIDYYLNHGGLKKIRFIKFGMCKDFEDAVDLQDHKESEGYLELTAHAPRGLNKYLPFKKRIQEVVDRKRGVNNIIELKEYNFEYDKVKIEVEINKKSRTIDLSDLYKIRAYYDITDTVKMAENGHPIFKSIDEIAHDLLDDLGVAIGWKLE